jgi:hypothetical protein
VTEKIRVVPPTTPMSSPEDEKSTGVPLAFIGLVWRSLSAFVPALVRRGRRMWWDYGEANV